jgi:hypothetical protein
MCVLALPANANYSGGTGEPNDPYQIATAADLIALGETPDDYDKHFILTADIDLDPNLPGRKVFDNAVIAGAWKLPFTGVFDGNGRTISHLTVVGTSSLGLFGQLGWNFQGQSYGEPTCTVTNLALENVDIVGSESSAGALAAYIEWAVVSHSRSTGKVSGKSPVGGLVGYNQHAVIHCHSGCTVTGGSDVGGLVGNNNGSVANCYSTGTVNGGSAVGGLVGWHRGSITQSFSTGVVSGKDAVGGLVGRNGIDLIPRRVLQPGDIDRSYSTASVRGETYVGGLIGDDRCGSVRQCYSTGAVSGSAQVGGLIGGLAWSLDVTTSFWDVEISGLTVSSAGQGKTTAQMRTANTFLNAGWDFVGETANGTEDIWRISEGRDYPRLSWERVLEDDFEDGEAGSLWLAYEPDASKIRVLEKGGRLEVHASAQADNIDAAYVSNGWRLDVAEDFALRVDFHCGKRDVGDSWVMVALLPSLEEPVSRIITFEAGCMNEQPFFLYEAIDGFWRHEEESDRSSDDGTLYVSYDAARDELYLSHTGYGKANAWRTVAGLLGDRWQGEPVYVAIGGGSDGVILEPGDAWLDDFIISSGTLVSAKSDGTGDSDD